MNITLSAPPATVAEVREWAEQNGTSLNEYIRDCLEFKAGEIRALRLKRAQEFYEFAMANPIKVPKGFKFNRREASERKMRCMA